jgi:hypothetical protein
MLARTLGFLLSGVSAESKINYTLCALCASAVRNIKQVKEAF